MAVAQSASEPAAATAALEARQVSMRFGGLMALSEVDLAAAPATITGLVGPNGAGKTTLFGVLSGLLRPTAGEVLLGGQDVTRSSPQSRARRGMARTFQRMELFSELTVREHLVLAYRARHPRHRLWSDLLGLGRTVRDPRENEEVDGLLEQLGLTPVAQRQAASLPLGTGRLVEVARALAGEPRVVLLDEPSSGLDSNETDQLANVLRTAVSDRDVAFVLVEHNLELVLGICSTVHVLDFGRLIAVGTPEAIRKDPKVQAAYIGAPAAGGE